MQNSAPRGHWLKTKRMSKAVGSAADDSIALFMLPGVYHCGGGPGPSTHTAVQGADVDIYGRGLYRNDSTFRAAGNHGTDAVTLGIGLPLLAASALVLSLAACSEPAGDPAGLGSQSPEAQPSTRTGEPSTEEPSLPDGGYAWHRLPGTDDLPVGRVTTSPSDAGPCA